MTINLDPEIWNCLNCWKPFWGFHWGYCCAACKDSHLQEERS